MPGSRVSIAAVLLVTNQRQLEGIGCYTLWLHWLKGCIFRLSWVVLYFGNILLLLPPLFLDYMKCFTQYHITVHSSRYLIANHSAKFKKGDLPAVSETSGIELGTCSTFPKHFLERFRKKLRKISTQEPSVSEGAIGVEPPNAKSKVAANFHIPSDN